MSKEHLGKISKLVTKLEQKEAILFMLSDTHCRQILATTMNEPKSVCQVSKDCKIPLSCVYRRLKWLKKAKLVRVTGIITTKGPQKFLYQSKKKFVKTWFSRIDQLDG